MIALISKAITLYTYVLVIYALLSWFPGAYDSKIGQFIIRISRPYLSMFDRLNLSIGPIDFTIIVAIFVLQLAGQGLILILARLVYMI
ncbi:MULTISPECIES: YggT family protein [Enterococcaceae]|uniref:YggT family protein n=1 Tax=Enterococcaceae TaxID=81852 RepID=UPI0018F48BF1|nr:MULTISPECIES: YggT family protein [Enterococcaceae]MCI0130490.1 YggT family protein [Vagococcus sp. CY53-2]UNM90476.1 YggT family protein [Vagococcus sp. CY52-2]